MHIQFCCVSSQVRGYIVSFILRRSIVVRVCMVVCMYRGAFVHACMWLYVCMYVCFYVCAYASECVCL